MYSEGLGCCCCFCQWEHSARVLGRQPVCSRCLRLPNLLSMPPVPDPRLSGRRSHLVYSITRFDSSGGIFPTQPSSPAVMITFEGSAPHPKIIVPDALKASPSPGPPSPVPPVWRNASPMFAPLAPQPFLSRPLRSTPSLGTLTPPIPHGVSCHRDDDGVWCHLCRSTGTDCISKTSSRLKTV